MGRVPQDGRGIRSRAAGATTGLDRELLVVAGGKDLVRDPDGNRTVSD